MNITAVFGSPRAKGNSETLGEAFLQEAERGGAKVERFHVNRLDISGCQSCYACKKDRESCVLKDDATTILESVRVCDVLLLAFPVYFFDLPAQMKALIDRAGMVGIANNHMFKRKIGASVVAARRGGSIHAFNSMNHFFLISEMIIPGSNYWNLGFGLGKGEVEKDEEAIQTMKVLGENMAWLLRKTRS